MTADVRRARTAFLWVGVILPLTVLAVSAVIVAFWLPDMPEPAAIHWGEDGVDGFGPGWTYLVVLGGIAAMVTAFALLAWFAHRLPQNGQPVPSAEAERPQWSITARFLGAMNLGTVALIALITLVGVGSQRGLADAADTPDIGIEVLIGFVLMAAGIAIGWFLQPATPLPESSRTEDSATPLQTSSSERLVWIGTAAIAGSGLAVLGGAALLGCSLAAIMIATGAGGLMTAIIMLAACAILIAALATTFAFRVRIGPAGLLVRSLTGWPRIEIPAADVASVRAIQVDPFAEFGGWGLRYGLDGRYGVVLRRGEAVEVTRVGGRRFVVTVDEAQTAAAALAAVAQREGRVA
ncbi:DUF1648 domain-containing protein [Microbacterium oxydans]|uniref:DUF1648 domain-containing protein n=1 Tax=Microbacterium oxydans TaxID=82380 RepID=UPI00226B01AB|nr:DUF1648 domain-containing protein [Microbacterium oxydans]WAA67245.1 DUF1648 domain-containing protein [Microbacterium oxydans]